jgi:hypothetical protein
MAAGARQANYLSQCLHHPHIMRQVNQRLTQNQQEMVNAADFSATDDQLLLQEVMRWLEKGTVATIDELCDSLDDALLERVQYLLNLPATPESELDHLAEKLVKSILDWRLNQAMRLNSEVRQLVEEAKSTNDTLALQTYKRQSVEFSHQIRRINQAKHAMSAMNRRQT